MKIVIGEAQWKWIKQQMKEQGIVPKKLIISHNHKSNAVLEDVRGRWDGYLLKDSWTCHYKDLDSALGDIALLCDEIERLEKQRDNTYYTQELNKRYQKRDD